MKKLPVERTSEAVFVLLNGVLSDESTEMTDFVLSMEVVEIGCAMGSVLAGRVCP